MIRASFHLDRRPWARGVVLLEIVLGLVLFGLTAMVVLSSLSVSTQAVGQLRFQSQASDLAASVVAEILLGVRSGAEPGPEPFEAPFEDFTWQISTLRSFTEAVNAPDVIYLSVTVRHQWEPAVASLTVLLADEAGLIPDEFEEPEGFEGGGM